MGLILLFSLSISLNGQIIVFFPTGIIARAIMPEHGFLPGSKFRFYPTIGKYDFSRLKLRIEVYDDRGLAKLNKVECSDLEFTNTSEFAQPDCINLLAKYVDTLFNQAGAVIDSSSVDTVQIHLEGIDVRLIGFGKIRAHGLCQLKIKYHNLTKSYCIDITDADKDSPIGPNAFVSRRTGTRIIGSAAMRETLEQFFKDIKIGS
jgi:hypothetical protein